MPCRYWITQLYGDASNGYSVSVVYSCSTGVESAMWVLSRTPALPADIPISEIYATATKAGINVTALQMQDTEQDCDF